MGGVLNFLYSPAPGLSAPRSPSEPALGDAQAATDDTDVPPPGLILPVPLGPGRRLPSRPGVGEHVTRGTAPQPRGRPGYTRRNRDSGGATIARDHGVRLAALRSRTRRGPRFGSASLLETG